jgi:hypothetical protein
MAGSNSLIAVYESDGRALEAARRVRNLGVDDGNIRVGESVDKLASIRGKTHGFGAFLRWFLGGAFRPERPTDPLAAAPGTTLAVPDSDDARHVLLTSGSLRVDLVSESGDPVATLAAYESRPAAHPGRDRPSARDERRRA